MTCPSLVRQLRVLSLTGNYVVVFDPLDGSSNIDAGISTGSIFGIYVRAPCLLGSWCCLSRHYHCLLLSVRAGRHGACQSSC